MKCLLCNFCRGFNFTAIQAFCYGKPIVGFFFHSMMQIRQGSNFQSLQETNDNLEDASNELILTDEEVIRFQIGEVFAHVPKDEVENRIEQIKEVTSQKLEKLEEEKESVLAQMAELKKILYAKFNDSINLEED